MLSSSRFVMCRELIVVKRHLPVKTGFPSSALRLEEGCSSTEEGCSSSSPSLTTLDPLRLLYEETQRTVKREAIIDATERVLPPLPPEGWTVVHKPGSRCILLQKDVIKKRRHIRGGGGVDEGRDRVEEELVQKLTAAPSSASPFLSSEQREKLKLKEDRQRLLDSVLGSKKRRQSLKQNQNSSASFSSSKQQQQQPPILPPDCYVFGEVTIQCPFHCIDPSFEDSAIGRAEWVPFDVRFSKVVDGGGNSGSGTGGSDQREYATDCVFVRAASVDSKLHVRSMQVLPYAKDNNHDTNGGKDSFPIMNSSTTKTFTTPSAAAAGGAGMATLLAESVGEKKTPGIRTSVSQSYGWSEEDRVQREHNQYCGPEIPKLPAALHQLLVEWLVLTLELSPTVVEFVCQMQYYSEHLEYLRWLGELEAWSQQ